MVLQPMSRRGLLGSSMAAVAWTRTAGGQNPRQDEPRSIRLGAPIFVKTEDPEELARAHRKHNYRAAYCPAVKLDDSSRIRDLSAAFEKHDVVIAEVGRWCNLLDADEDKRRANLKSVIEGLALADEIGARCCVDIAGSFNPKVWYGPHADNLTPKFFDAAVENARRIIDAVKPRRAKFCYEMMGWALPDSADAYLKMLKAIDRPGFAVHLDPCNLINSPDRFYRNTALLNQCFDKLGQWIVSCHAKDLTWDVEMNIHFREVGAGEGSLDYRTFLRRLAELSNSPPLMIEHLPDEAAYLKAARHIMGVGGEVGVEFG